MSQRSPDVRNVVIGLFTGVAVTLAMGQAGAPQPRTAGEIGTANAAVA